MKLNVNRISTLILIATLAILQGCSLVELLPSSSCHHVEYVRVDNVVNVKATCRV